MQLNQLKDNQGARQNRKRVGRGIGSGTGKTAGRGHKGQKSRTGVSIKGFEGGQMPIHRRLPKRGFTNANRIAYSTVNTGDLQRAIDAKRIKASDTLTQAFLVEKGLVRDCEHGIKLLAKGELTAKVKIEVVKASNAAQEQVKNAGGEISFVDSPKAQKSKAYADAKAAEKSKK